MFKVSSKLGSKGRRKSLFNNNPPPPSPALKKQQKILVMMNVTLQPLSFHSDNSGAWGGGRRCPRGTARAREGARTRVPLSCMCFEIWTDKTSWIILPSYVLNSLLCGTGSP